MHKQKLASYKVVVNFCLQPLSFANSLGEERLFELMSTSLIEADSCFTIR